MSKEHKRSERADERNPATEGSTADAARGPRIEDILQQKLGPLDEHRQRTDSWMKEITSQVARLASDAEGDDRRAGSIDKRIADLESRIQSLLTLTEVVSLDKNPFAERGSGPSPSPLPSQGPAASEKPAAAPEQPTPRAEALSQAASRPVSESSDPAPRADDGHDAAEPAQADPVPGDGERIRNALSPARRARLAAALDDAPVASAATRAAPSPHRHANHPNDAAAEPLDNPFVDPDPIRPPHHAPAGVNGATRPPASPDEPAAPVNETRRRLMILQWAQLLSHELPRLDLGSFLGFYVETGWVDRPLAACVRNLAWQLHQAARHDPVEPAHSLPELHARSILMLSHLSDAPVPTADARRIVEDAREAMDAPILVQEQA